GARARAPRAGREAAAGRARGGLEERAVAERRHRGRSDPCPTAPRARLSGLLPGGRRRGRDRRGARAREPAPRGDDAAPRRTPRGNAGAPVRARARARPRGVLRGPLGAPARPLVRLTSLASGSLRAPLRCACGARSGRPSLALVRLTSLASGSL